MKTYTVSTLAEASGGKILSGNAQCSVSNGVCTDTRDLRADSLFIALVGDKFDAHDFIADAAQSAAAVMLSKKPETELPCPVILVPDTLIALQKLAAWYRRQLTLTVVGITGSNGKTSTKDFTRAVLSQKFNTYATRGNLNNHIGVPLTILSLNDSYQAAVIEMGMNHRGEIAPLCRIAAPDLGIITNIGSAHIENLGTRDAIAEEKSTLGRALPERGTLLIPAASDYHSFLAQRTKARVIFAGNCRGKIRAENLRPDLSGTRFQLIIGDHPPVEVFLPVPGRHMVANALLAAGIGHCLGISPEEIAAGLQNAEISGGRLQQFHAKGCTVIDDSYNANPESMSAALQTLAESPASAGARRFAVLGHMAELGETATAAHQRIGRLAAQLKIDFIIAVGPLARGIAEAASAEGEACTVLDFERHEDAAQAIASRFKPGDLLLFKGSRSAAMETIIHQLFPPSEVRENITTCSP